MTNRVGSSVIQQRQLFTEIAKGVLLWKSCLGFPSSLFRPNLLLLTKEEFVVIVWREKVDLFSYSTTQMRSDVK